MMLAEHSKRMSGKDPTVAAQSLRVNLDIFVSCNCCVSMVQARSWKLPRHVKTNVYARVNDILAAEDCLKLKGLSKRYNRTDHASRARYLMNIRNTNRTKVGAASKRVYVVQEKPMLPISRPYPKFVHVSRVNSLKTLI
jgi:hypothetical protein